MNGANGAPDFGALGFDQALRQLGEALAEHPDAAQRVWQRFADDCMAAGIATMTSAAAGERAEPTIAPERGDRRFRDAAWQDNPVYSGMLQGYLLWSRMLRELVDVAELDRSTDRKARFAVDAMIDALAPAVSYARFSAAGLVGRKLVGARASKASATASRAFWSVTRSPCPAASRSSPSRRAARYACRSAK